MDLASRHPELKDVLRRAPVRAAPLCRRAHFVAAHFLDADVCVRWALLQLIRIYTDGNEIVVLLTQENLAELAGTARGTVNRVLREEHDRGAVALERGRVRVLDVEALARACVGCRASDPAVRARQGFRGGVGPVGVISGGAWCAARLRLLVTDDGARDDKGGNLPHLALLRAR